MCRPKGRASRPNMPGGFVSFAPVPRRSKLTSYYPETPPQPVDMACKSPSDNRIFAFDVYVVHNSPSQFPSSLELRKCGICEGISSGTG